MPESLIWQRSIPRLEPHVVLRCAVHDGGCEVAHNTSAAGVWRRRLSNRVGRKLLYGHEVQLPQLHAGSTCSALGTTSNSSAGPEPPPLVCVGHWHNSFGLYFSFLYKMQSMPPYRIVAVSYPFRFRRYFDDDRDNIQFASGTALDAEAARLRISFGVADCVAAETTVRLADVHAMLSGNLVMPRL